MTRPRPWLIVAAALLLAAALIALVLGEDHARRQGTEVALRVQQVDPRSLLSGHYSQLDFVEDTPPGFNCGALASYFELSFLHKAPRWIALRPNGDHHSFAGAGKTREQAAQHGALLVRGDASCRGGSDQQQVEINIGLNRFHASQKEAQALDALIRDPKQHAVYALVSVGKDGHPRLAGLRVDGKDTRLDWFGR
jgi:hypothetical protein